MTFGGEVDMRTIGVPVVHAVTSDDVVARPDFLDVARGVMAVLGARGALHLRAHRIGGARFQAIAEGLAATQELTGAWLVITDRIDVALAAGARGAQLTSLSLAPGDARRIAPLLALGASVHDMEDARLAVAGGADWLVADRIFAPDPGGAGRGGTAWVRALVNSTSVPVIAIGGARPGHAVAARTLGLHGVAVIRGIWNAPNAERAAGDYLTAYDDAAAG